ncbi:hypothetical protein ACFSQ7_03925 [Paenibacillus rhizoplanae]
MDQTWAYILMVCNHKPQEFDCLLLDSASLSIAQELLRTRYMEERKLFSENLWVEELVGGTQPGRQPAQGAGRPGLQPGQRAALPGLPDRDRESPGCQMEQLGE